MAECARIAVKRGDVFRSVYLRFSSGVIDVLLSHYGNAEAVDALLDLGMLWKVNIFHGGSVPIPGHSVDRPKPNFTLALHRDAGEKFLPAVFSKSLGDLLSLCSEADVDCVYMFDVDAGSWSSMKRYNW